MSAKRFLLPMTLGLFAGLIISAAVVALVLNRMRPTSPAEAASVESQNEITGPPVSGPPVQFDAPAFSYIDQDGNRVSNRDLLGRPWIADFIFTRCTTVCPVLTARMILLQHKLSDPAIRFISFSVDPSYDQPAILKQYAAKWHGDESRWRLLNTKDDQTLHETSRGMHVAVQTSTDPINPILHTNRFILVDAAGRVRGQYDSTDSEAVKQMISDAQDLLGMPAHSSGSPGMFSYTQNLSGKQLFAAVGCEACHMQAQVAPPLAGIAGATIMLEGGKTAIADDDYLRESIIDPNAKIVAGYLPRMPSYRDQLTEAQVGQLVDYIKSLGSGSPGELIGPATVPAAASTGATAQSTDPVCKMTIAIGPETLHANFAGHTYYFCSELCRDHFLKNPRAFVLLASPPN